MRVRNVLLASVCAAFLAAPAATSGAQSADGSSPTSLIAQGYQALVAGETTNAVSAFSEAIESRELAPEQLANALLNRGLAHQRAGQFKESVEDYEAALRIDAMGAELRATALYNRGLAFQKLGKPALAIEDFTSALLLDSHFAHAYFSRGTVLRESGQYLFALSDYEKALHFNHPQAYLVYYGEALAHEALKHRDLAQKSLAKAIAANPSFEPARQKLSSLTAIEPQAASTGSALATASITPTGDDQVVRREIVPEPVKPHSNLVQMAAAQLPEVSTASAAEPGAASKVGRSKLYTDRVPQEDVQPPPPVFLSRINQKSRIVAADPKPPQVKVVAVEPLPDAEPVSHPAEAEQSKAMEPADPPATDPAAAEPVTLTGWGIQLSSARDEKLAWGTWNKLKSRHDILADLKPMVQRADLGSKGVYYRLRLGGFDSSTDARSLCSKLKSRGIACFVSKLSS